MRIVLTSALMFSSNVIASAQVAGQTYVSLDGAMEHQFLASGDYIGKIHGKENLTVSGVYLHGPETCWMNNSVGGKTPGNLLFFVGEVQCCLQVQNISDKSAFSQIWVEGTGPGYQLCKNQVFKRNSSDVLTN